MTDTTAPPSAITESLSGCDLTRFQRWWARLPHAWRVELQRLWDPRQEEIGWTKPEPSLDWERLPIRLEGRTAEDSELGPEGRLMKRQLLDFILNHEEIAFFLEERHFHICRKHTQARAVLAKGVLPAGFRCSLRGEDCPMRTISKVAGERAVLIRLRVR